MDRSRARELIIFFAFAYAISWAIWLPLILSKRGLGLLSAQFPFAAAVSIGTVGPSLAAFIAQKLSQGNWRAFRTWTSWRQLSIGIAAGSIPLLIACFASAITATRSGYSLWNWRALLQIPYLFFPNLLGGPLGEEPGWRGFALPRLQAIFRPAPASIILGFVWANWHLPLFLVHFSSIPYWLYVPLLIAAPIMIAFEFNMSGGGAIAAIYLHGLLNVGIGVIMNDFPGKAAIRKSPSEDAIIAGSFVLMAILLAIATRGRLGLKRAVENLAAARAG